MTYDLAWDDDSSRIYYTRSIAGDAQIWSFRIDDPVPTPQLFFDPPAFATRGLTVSGDGRKYLAMAQASCFELRG